MAPAAPFHAFMWQFFGCTFNCPSPTLSISLFSRSGANGPADNHPISPFSFLPPPLSPPSPSLPLQLSPSCCPKWFTRLRKDSAKWRHLTLLERLESLERHPIAWVAKSGQIVPYHLARCSGRTALLAALVCRSTTRAISVFLILAATLPASPTHTFAKQEKEERQFQISFWDFPNVNKNTKIFCDLRCFVQAENE